MDEVYYLKMTDHEGRTPRMVKVDVRAMADSRVRNERNTLLYAHCTVCGRAVERDPRGEVLDSSGRCDECRP